MKEKLIKLYEEKLDEFKQLADDFQDVSLKGPLLMHPNEGYVKSNLKLLVVGRETSGWNNIEAGIKGLMETYRRFNMGENGKETAFWNVVRKLERKLGIEAYSCLWTNLSKYDKDGESPKGSLAKHTAEIDNLLADEISIIQPDVCVIFSGPNLDNRLREVFPGLVIKEAEGWKKNQLAKLEHEQLPQLTVRTYLPSGLRQHGLEEPFLNYIEEQAKALNLI